MTYTPEQKAAVLGLLSAIVDAVKAAGELGAPGGTIYAALMEQGCTLSQYETLIGVLIEMKKIRKRGDLLFAL